MAAPSEAHCGLIAGRFDARQVEHDVEAGLDLSDGGRNGAELCRLVEFRIIIPGHLEAFRFQTTDELGAGPPPFLSR